MQPSCVTACSTDHDCSGNLTCIGTADDGATFCLLDQCLEDADCLGVGRCHEGRCACTGSDECTAFDLNVCAIR